MNTNNNQELTDPLQIIQQKDEIITKLTEENDSLNNKIGNLFFIYQTVSKMFDQLSAEQFAQIAVEAFSELTDSELTTLFMKNDDSGAYELVMHRSLKRDKPMKVLYIYPQKDIKLYMPSYADLTEESQRDIIVSQFYNGEEFVKKINPYLLISIKTESQIRGFITIGKKKSGGGYSYETIQIIESLGRALSLVFSTERTFSTIKEQKESINRKLKNMMDLNDLAKIINSVTTIDAVASLIISALSVTYGANLAFFALYDSDQMVLNIQSSIGTKEQVTQLPVKGGLLPLLIGEKIIEVESEKVNTLFEDVFMEDLLIEPKGACVMPIYVEEFDIKLIGAIGLLSTESGVLTTHDNVMAIEFMASHIAPIIYHINRVDHFKMIYHPDYYHTFIEALKTNIYGVDIFNLELYVLWVNNNKKLQLVNNDIVSRIFGKFDDVYCVDNQNTLLLTTDYDDIHFISSLLSEDETLTTYQYKKDFNSVEEFIQLF